MTRSNNAVQAPHQPATPPPDLKGLNSTWKQSGGMAGTTAYAWMEGGGGGGYEATATRIKSGDAL